MYVTIEIPEIAEFPNGFQSYWAKTLFIGKVSADYKINALASTYMRLVEAALVEYRLARPQLNAFWNTHDSFNLSAMHRAISHFETCLTNMHRAISCFVRFRRRPEVPDELRATLNKEKPEFIAARVSDRLREMRNAIHHLEERVADGTIGEGESFVLAPDGIETPHPTEPGQTDKVIDRLKIGSQEILFSELAGWLTEMARFAEKISTYEPHK